jgi:AcrR family transcriptional regulator
MSSATPFSLLANVLRPRKGELTRASIVEAALEMASREGLEGLTIGSLAERMKMSKSGLFAHFGSREDLQRAVLKEYEHRFIEEVLRPAVRKPRGLPRLEAILERWVAFLARELAHGCILIAGAVEYDDRPGALRDEMVAIVTGWKSELLKAIRQAAAEGHLRRGIDAHQMVFEIYGVMLAIHQDARLLRSADSTRRGRAALKRLLAASKSPGAAASLPAPPQPRLQTAKPRRLRSPKTAA